MTTISIYFVSVLVNLGFFYVIEFGSKQKSKLYNFKINFIVTLFLHIFFSFFRMPKIKKIKNKENNLPKKMATKKQNKQIFNFDMKKILKERQAESEYWKRSEELDKEIKAVNILYDKEINQIKEQSSVSPKFGFIIFNGSKYNILFKNINDANITSLSQKFIKMSVEKNELVANIHYNNLVNANWSPALNASLSIYFFFFFNNY